MGRRDLEERGHEVGEERRGEFKKTFKKRREGVEEGGGEATERENVGAVRT